MLKRLFLIWIFSGSLDSFSQALPELPKSEYTLEVKPFTGEVVPDVRDVAKPDTLRAICLVTLFQNGIAHARMGYVVIGEGKEVQYLDCRKQALKLPQVGWGWRVVNPNNQK